MFQKIKKCLGFDAEKDIVAGDSDAKCGCDLPDQTELDPGEPEEEIPLAKGQLAHPWMVNS